MKLFDREHAQRLWTTGSGYHILFALLLGLFLITAVATQLGLSALLMRGLYQLIFFEALLAAATTRRQLRIGAALFAPTVLSWLMIGEDSVFRLAIGDTLWAGVLPLASSAFLFYLVGLTVARLFKQGKVGWTSVSAACSGYLMLGLAWSGLYGYIERLAPGSFRGLSGSGLDAREGELFYFSFVTLTTLGYGDVSPVGHAAQMVTVLEAIVGQLYLVILIARLVGMVGVAKSD